jgi:hypothetical protein
MSFDSDVALIGTGLAPLIAASHLLHQGKSVLILNPDYDFFLENSELPIDPFLPVGSKTLRANRIARSLPENALKELRPYFPGPVEFWAEGATPSGYHDPLAPHVRSRARLWVSSDGPLDPATLELFEELYVHASDKGLNPQILEGIPASSRFPGISLPRDLDRGLLIPKLCDVDVPRYRNGVLEFVRERLGKERMITEAAQIQLMPGGLRFYWGGAPRTAKLTEGAMVFWTPRLSNWIFGQAKQFERTPRMPAGLRLWEQWSMVSRDELDPGVVGVFNPDIAVWAESEGIPDKKKLFQLSVLRIGDLLPQKAQDVQDTMQTMSWASKEAFTRLSSLCHGFLRWDRFSVRAMMARAVLEWEAETPLWDLKAPDPSDKGDRVKVVAGSDGPIVDVVRNVRLACEQLYGAAS